MGPRGYALSTHGNESEVGLWEAKKRKRPRGRRMRGLILNTAWEEECRIPYRVLGGGVNSMKKCLPAPLLYSNGH
jgi:hypothetical protein